MDAYYSLSDSIMPPGLRHAVFSVAKQGFRPTSVLMSGSHFISEYTLSAMLQAAISHSLWHDVWTNATHDDVSVQMDRILHRLILDSESDNRSLRLKGKNLFALLTYARFAPWLRSLPHQRYVEDPEWLYSFNAIKELEERIGENPSTSAATQRTLATLDAMARKADYFIRGIVGPDRDLFNSFWESSHAALVNEIDRRVQYNIAHSQ